MACPSGGPARFRIEYLARSDPGMKLMVICVCALAGAPDKFGAPDQGASGMSLMRLRGGDATKLRPGSLDYSKWDEVSFLLLMRLRFLLRLL